MSAGLAALFKGKLPPRAEEHDYVPGSASALAAIEEDIPDSQPGVSLYGAFEHEEYDAAEESEESVEPLVPGEGQREVLDAGDLDTQVNRLQAWETQLQAYSDSLTEKGWDEWKKGQVTQIMQQLRRTVVPDVWRDDVMRAEAEAAASKERVERAAEKEAGLLKKIEELESGPGCAKELREKLETLELQLSQQQARERQQSVFKQLLTTGAVSANAGGGAAASAAMRRRATIAEIGSVQSTGGGAAAPKLFKGKSAPITSAKGEAAPAKADSSAVAEQDARADARADEAADGAGGEEEESADVEILRIQLTRTQNEAREAQEEMRMMRVAHEERSTTLEQALEHERAQHRHAVEALESQHVVAGVHEAQEMVQLRMELVAANEELDFLRAREAKVHEEENRLQMVAEMSKRLGTNVSRFELESLRSRVTSLQEEAERVHAHNQQLQKEAKRAVAADVSVERLRAEISAFQTANDALEVDLVRRDHHRKSLEDQVHTANARIELLQRQLVLSHAQRQYAPQSKAGASEGQEPSSMQPLAPPESPHVAPADSGVRRKLPLLWDGSPGDGMLTGIGRTPGEDERMPLVPVHHQAGRQPATSRLAVLGGSPQRAEGSVVRGAGGAVTERAVVLHDEVASQPIVIERLAPAEPRIAQAFPADACRSVRVRDNAAELAAAAAWREAHEVYGVNMHRELKRAADASEQELLVVRGNIASQVLHARVAKLGSTRHYMMIAMMRALCKWALLLELDDSYHAALTQAAHMIEGRADELAGELQSAQQQTVNTLLLQPKMLGELGDMRRKLQVAASETEHLRGGLRKMAEREEEQQLLRQVTTQMLPLESGKAALDRRFNPPKAVAAVEAPPSAESQEVVRARELHRRQQQRLLDAVRLKLRLTVHQWRQSKAAYAKQVELMRQLSAQREEEREAAALQSEVLRRLQLEQHELLIEQETWRNQSAEQADVLAAAIATAANGTIQHEDEVVLLSEKLRQVLEEKAGLEALVDSQSADLKIMSSEMIRMMAS